MLPIKVNHVSLNFTLGSLQYIIQIMQYMFSVCVSLSYRWGLISTPYMTITNFTSKAREMYM